MIASNFLTKGPPGAGKSTSAQLLSRTEGYVYYEADCFGTFMNPFIDPNVEEPSLAQVSQRPLKVRLVLISVLSTITYNTFMHRMFHVVWLTLCKVQMKLQRW